MDQFECKACGHRESALTPPTVCGACDSKKGFYYIETICLLVQAKELPDNHIVHTTTLKPNDVQEFVSTEVTGMQWVTACNKLTLPKVTTTHFSAVTCGNCLNKLKQLHQRILESQKADLPDNSNIPNPFKPKGTLT